MALGRDPKEADPTQGLVAEVILRTPHGTRIANALIDTGAQENFISQRFIVEEEMKPEPTSTGAHTVDGHRIAIYGRHTVETRALDSRGVSRAINQTFLATDMKAYDAILGYPWLTAADPECQWAERKWTYREEQAQEQTKDIRIIKANKMHIAMRSASTFLIYVQPAAAKRDAGVSLYSTETIDISLPEEYAEYADVFSEEGAASLPDHTRVEHAIPIQDGEEVPYGSLYPLSGVELRALAEYLETNLARGWIRKSESPAGAPILFSKKKDGSLRLCVDYRGLNKITVKNRLALPLISETLDRVVGAARFTKLDLRDAYHRIRIKRGDEWKTAFRTRYGHFEYLVMPFGLTNAPATFQAYINEALRGLLDVICVAYMDDILIYSFAAEDHADHVRAVLERLRQYSLYVKLSKCEFHASEVDFLGYRIGVAGISMDMRRVQTITEWPTPNSFRDIQVFIGFVNFYRRFIYAFSRVVAPITDLLAGMEKGKKSGPFTWTEKADSAFRELKDCFTHAPLLQHFDPEKVSKLETDASGAGIAGIISQPCEEHGKLVWKPVAFFSRKLSSAEKNYGTGDAEMLAIVESFREWRHYLESPAYPVRVLCDHENLQSFMTTKTLNRRQARWAEFLASFDFVIEYRKGKENPADGPSRRPDYTDTEEDVGNPLRELLTQRMEVASDSCTDHTRDESSYSARIAVLTRSKSKVDTPRGEVWSTLPRPTAEGTDEAQEPPAPRRRRAKGSREKPETTSPELTPYGKIPDALTSHLLALQHRDAWCKERSWEALPGGTVKEGPFKGTWSEDHSGLVRHDGAVYIPQDRATQMEILRVNHDDPWQGGHFGQTRTLEVVRRHYWWVGLGKSVRDYVETCDICQRMKAPRHKPYGTLVPLPQPEREWQDISLDFITGLPPAARGGKAYDAILVVVDRFSKMVRYIACTSEIDAPEMAERLIDEIFSKFGTPRSIVSDRGTTFTASYWGTLCYYLTVKRRLSTAFHPQTDGQTERANQTLECYLRCYVNYQQDDWLRLLPSAEFACNDHVNASTGKSPFETVLRYAPQFRMQPALQAPMRDGDNPAAKELAARIEENLQESQKLWKHAQETMSKHYDKKHKDKTYQVGEKVMLSAKNIRMRRPSKKLADRYVGPFTILEVVGKNAYKLDLPKSYGRIHPTFHVSLLEKYQRREGVEPPEPVEVDGEEWWEVESILDEVKTHGKRKFLVRWKGFTAENDTWEPEENLTNVQEKIQEFREGRSDAKASHKRGAGAKRANTLR